MAVVALTVTWVNLCNGTWQYASDAWVCMGIRVYIYSTSMTFYLETRRVGHRPKNVVPPNPEES